jgi:hypothetical protein
MDFRQTWTEPNLLGILRLCRSSDGNLLTLSLAMGPGFGMAQFWDGAVLDWRANCEEGRPEPPFFTAFLSLSLRQMRGGYGRL